MEKLIALILAGGYGKRLRPYTDTLPKPMIEVGGKPILEWQIEWLKSH
ncbi:MAG: sugar phosphate nucleotidyltransferase, partial [Fervidicoccaceae archaeon]